VVLHPGDADPELLNSLHLVGIEIHVPDSWSAPATLCTRIEEGWNDCLPLDGSLPFPRSMSVFVGEAPVLELWLVDEDGDLSEPLQRLGAIQVPSDVIEGRVPLVVRLDGSLNADGTSVERPGVSLVGAT
jgi:hypothetical protein